MDDLIDSQEINDIAEGILSTMTEDDIKTATQLLDTVDVSGILDERSPDNITFTEDFPDMLLPYMDDLDLLPSDPTLSMRNINSSRAKDRTISRIRKKTPRRRSTYTAPPIIPSVSSRGIVRSRPQFFMDQVIPGSYDHRLPEYNSTQTPPVPEDFPSVSSRGRVRSSYGLQYSRSYDNF